MPRPFKPFSELKHPRRPNGGHTPFSLSHYRESGRWRHSELLALCSSSLPRNPAKRTAYCPPVRPFHLARISSASLHLQTFLSLHSIPPQIFTTTSTHRAIIIARHHCYSYLHSLGFSPGVIARVCNAWITSVTYSLANSRYPHLPFIPS